MGVLKRVIEEDSCRR